MENSTRLKGGLIPLLIFLLGVALHGESLLEYKQIPQKKQITPDGVNCSFPVPVPGENYIAYIKRDPKEEGEKQDIWMIDLLTRKEYLVMPNAGRFDLYKTKGGIFMLYPSKIKTGKTDSSNTPGKYDTDIYEANFDIEKIKTINIITQSGKILTNNTPLNHEDSRLCLYTDGASQTEPTCSEDGSRIACASLENKLTKNGQAYDKDIFVFDAKHGIKSLVVGSKGNDTEPSLSPCGKYLVYTKMVGGYSHPYFLPLDINLPEKPNEFIKKMIADGGVSLTKKAGFYEENPRFFRDGSHMISYTTTDVMGSDNRNPSKRLNRQVAYMGVSRLIQAFENGTYLKPGFDPLKYVDYYELSTVNDSDKFFPIVYKPKDQGKLILLYASKEYSDERRLGGSLYKGEVILNKKEK